jgi:signal transduction histidine kinase/CheY-like chemotaxis protein
METETHSRSENLTPVVLAALLDDHKDLLLEKWAARVLADPDLPIAPKLSPPALYDHFPEIVTRLAVTLRTLDDHPEALGRLVGSTAEAEAHISQRVEAEYSVPEVLRELSHLRLAIIDLCKGAVPNGASAAILHAAFDQMMINAADELSGIVLEGRKRAEALANERNVLYERERDARQACEEADRAKDQFLAMVSHELRTPLNAITGWAEMLERKQNDVHLRERAIATIQRNANVQARLIDGLLDISRLRSGRVSFQRVPVDVAGLLRSLIESFTPAFAEKKLRVDLSLLPIESTAMGDEERLRQVFTNLLGNAIKFTPEGGTVRVSMEGSSDLVRVEVSDSGVGIPSDFLPHVFEPFRQADSSWTRDHSGLGLGLAIVKAIVDLHGGTIEPVSNGHGEGATFRIALPAATKEHCAKDGTNGPSTQSTQSTQAASSRLERRLSGVRVVVVDDDADARSLATAMLLDQGCDVREAGCASEAYELFENFQPHVLVTDLAMPGEDGVSLLRRVRKEYGPVPAIALSAFSGPSEIRTIAAGGFERHIVKPAALSDLASAIQDLVLRSSHEQPPRMSLDDSARRSVLVVEDDMAIAIELAELLREEGFAVRLASNGSEAWHELDQGFRPNVIVLDLMMPVMDGWTLRRKLLGEPRLASIPVVVLSGASAQDAAEVERVDDVLSKPFDFRTLLMILDRHTANSPLTKRTG